MPIPGGTTPASPVVAATITRPCYTSRESVAEALDIKLTARMHRAIDRAIQAASEDADQFCHRTFTPWQGSRTFDWPSRTSPSTSWRLWLDSNELISLASATAGGEALDTASLFLRPDDGPPFGRVEVDLSSNDLLTADQTWQRAISLTGLWGYRNDEAAAGALTGNVLVDDTSIAVTDSVSIGIGDLIRIGSERMLVVGRRSVDTGSTLTGSVAAQANVKTVSVPDGDVFVPGEVLAVDGERMRVDDVVGNTLVVSRPWDGTTLAAHDSGTSIYAGRILAVVRGYGGTTAASHPQDTEIVRHCPPELVSRYTRASALVTIQQEPSGWARTVGSGDNERQASGASLKGLRKELYETHGRKARHRAV